MKIILSFVVLSLNSCALLKQNYVANKVWNQQDEGQSSLGLIIGAEKKIFYFVNHDKNTDIVTFSEKNKGVSINIYQDCKVVLVHENNKLKTIYMLDSNRGFIPYSSNNKLGKRVRKNLINDGYSPSGILKTE